MKFTYSEYANLLVKLLEKGYQPSDYHDYAGKNRPVILRHDIDTSIKKAVKMSAVERQLGVKSTYFVLLTSDFYNTLSLESIRGLKQILIDGNKIGLHFDELRYPECAGNPNMVVDKIINEKEILEKFLNIPIDTVSMHRPSKQILDADLIIPGMVNSYGSEFFKNFKYISDSRRRWREPVEEIIESEKYNKIHILTHAFWYNDEELNIYDSINENIQTAKYDRYKCFYDNVSNLQEIIKENEI